MTERNMTMLKCSQCGAVVSDLAHTPLIEKCVALRFRKKPVVIEAMQFDGSGLAVDRLSAWSNGAVKYNDNDGVYVSTLEGVLHVSDGDWVIRGVKGEYYPRKPDIFAATYEPADALTESSPPQLRRYTS